MGDIAILVGAGFSQLILAWLGFRVSVHQPQTKLQKHAYEAAFIAVGLIGVGLIAWSAISAQRDQQTASKKLDEIAKAVNINPDQPTQVLVQEILKRLPSSIRTVSGATTIIETDQTINFDASSGPIEQILPPTETLYVGQKFTFIKSDATKNAIAIKPAAADVFIPVDMPISLSIEGVSVSLQVMPAHKWEINP